MDDLRKSITFEVPVDDKPQTPRSSGIPRRLAHQGPARPMTPQDLETKQRKAEERRKAYEAAKLERIVQLEGQPKKKRSESQ